MSALKIRRALLSVSNKREIVELGQALAKAGAEIVATGRTAQVLEKAGIPVIPIEQISGSPESFQGRMKTLSFPVCSGILFRRDDPDDIRDADQLGIKPIDCVVVNFYPFEQTLKDLRQGGEVDRATLIEQVDIGGPTLVRAAAKNAPDVLVLTRPDLYSAVIDELDDGGAVSHETVFKCAAACWEDVSDYDLAIARELGSRQIRELRYGENPHQRASLTIDSNSAIDWEEKLTPNELSYNNILDMSAAYSLASSLALSFERGQGVIIVKHNNPCGVAWSDTLSQIEVLKRAWEGDPVSAFGGVLIFTQAIQEETALWLRQNFIELIAAPRWDRRVLGLILEKRKKLKALSIREWGASPSEQELRVPGGVLRQTSDEGPIEEELRSVTAIPWPEERSKLARFGIAVTRALKSNAVAFVRDIEGTYQLIGTGQGQPNRVEAIAKLAIPRAKAVAGDLKDSILVSDAFFPFKDSIEYCADAGIRFVVQPGGSIQDPEVIKAANERGMVMALTGTRHFRH